MAEADALVANFDAFGQGLVVWRPAASGAPGCSLMEGSRVIAIRHRTSAPAVQAALDGAGLAWPANTGATATHAATEATAVKADVLPKLIAVRRSPEDTLLIGSDEVACDAILAALEPGRLQDAGAIDVSHGTAIVRLQGPHLDDWLAHLVDALSIPRRRGTATRARLADIAVVLVRERDDRLWLMCDRAVATYAANWLAFAHEGAFGITQ